MLKRKPSVRPNCATKSNETEVVENEVSTEVATVSNDGLYGEEITADDVVEMDNCITLAGEDHQPAEYLSHPHLLRLN